MLNDLAIFHLVQVCTFASCQRVLCGVDVQDWLIVEPYIGTIGGEQKNFSTEGGLLFKKSLEDLNKPIQPIRLVDVVFYVIVAVDSGQNVEIMRWIEEFCPELADDFFVACHLRSTDRFSHSLCHLFKHGMTADSLLRDRLLCFPMFDDSTIIQSVNLNKG